MNFQNKMGTYVVGQDEIEGAFEDLLNELDGEVFKNDVEKATEKVINKYKHFSK